MGALGLVGLVQIATRFRNFDRDDALESSS
jgi:hypothetical protein